MATVIFPAHVRGVRSREAAVLQEHRNFSIGRPLANHVGRNVAEQQGTAAALADPNRALREDEIARNSFERGAFGNHFVESRVQPDHRNRRGRLRPPRAQASEDKCQDSEQVISHRKPPRKFAAADEVQSTREGLARPSTWAPRKDMS